MSTISFGKALGEIIRQKRKAVGLTQLQLSEDAFGTSAKTRRISEIESGLTDNPHAKTIDPIISVLKITDAELANCAALAVYVPDPALDRAYKEARKMIDGLAVAFEHNEPNATLTELDRYLRDKAKEWSELRDRIARLEADTNNLSQYLDSALDYLSKGEFDKVDDCLLTAEENFQNKETLKVIRKQAEVRIMRADAKLINGDIDSAISLYKSSAEFLRPFDEREMATLLDELAHRLYESSRRALRPFFLIAAELLELQITLSSVQRDPELEKKSQYRLGLIYRNEYRSRRGPEKIGFLDKAIFYASEAANLADDRSHQFTVSKISWANCLMDRGTENEDISDLKRAISIFRSLQKMELLEAIPLRPHISNSIGVALLECGRIAPPQHQDASLSEVEAAFSDAIIWSEKTENIETWSTAKLNLGNVLINKSTSKEDNGNSQNFLRIRAIGCILSAIECFPETAFPYQLAEAHRLLSKGLYIHSKYTNEEISELYLARAIHSLEIASNIYASSPNKYHLAEIKIEIAKILYAHCTNFDHAVETDISMALNHLEEAQEIYAEVSNAEGIQNCKKFIDVLLDKRNNPQN